MNRCGYPVAFRQALRADAKCEVTPIWHLLPVRDGGAGAAGGGGSPALGSAATPEDAAAVAAAAVAAATPHGEAGVASALEWTPMHWAQRGLAKHLCVRLLEPPRAPRRGSAASADDGGGALARAPLQLPGVGEVDDASSIWGWSHAFDLDRTDYTIKFRRRLVGPHATLRDVAAVEGSARRGIFELDLDEGSAAGVSPAAVAWLRAEIVTVGSLTFVTLLPHLPLVPPRQRTLAYRIDNQCSIDRLLVRQAGTGPSCAEVVPACAPEPAPYALDDVNDGKKELMFLARPVGVAALLYWAGGHVAARVSKGNFDKAAGCLRCALGGDEAGASDRSGDGSGDGWAVWGPVDGRCTVACDEIGGRQDLRVGLLVHSPALPARRLFFDVHADASTGPTKVIRVTDVPSAPREAAAYLKKRMEEVKGHIAIGEAVMADLAKRARAARQEGNDRARGSLAAGRMMDDDIAASVAGDGVGGGVVGYASMPEDVWVQFVGGVNLPVADSNGFSDPFATAYILEDKRTNVRLRGAVWCLRVFVCVCGGGGHTRMHIDMCVCGGRWG